MDDFSEAQKLCFLFHEIATDNRIDTYEPVGGVARVAGVLTS